MPWNNNPEPDHLCLEVNHRYSFHLSIIHSMKRINSREWQKSGGHPTELLNPNTEKRRVATPTKTPLLASTTKTVRVWTYCENVGHVKTLPIPSTHRQLSRPVQTSSFRGILNLQCRETRFLWPQHVLLASSSGLSLWLFSFLCSSNSMSSFMVSNRCCAQVVPKWASFFS